MTDESSIDQVFLKKLHCIVEDNLKDEHFGVNEVAQKIGLSRSQIHRKLKILTKQSVSQFIREIRLQKAMDLLQQNVATVSEIAFKVGFGSPTYFNKCFRDFYGITPGEARFKFVHGKKSIKKNLFYEVINKKRSKLLLFTITSLSLILITMLSFLLIMKIKGNDSYVINRVIKIDRSIAVLPFKYLSEDKSNQYIADGIMEDILNRLAQVHELKVISRISSDQYRNSSKFLPQIAKELHVSYILVGSVQKCDNSVRIFVQLIEAKGDNNLWSKQYDAYFENLLILQTNIAKSVTRELKAVLSKEEIVNIENRSTKNVKAYNSYLKGRYFWNRKTEKGLKTSLKYFNQSIAYDSTYALAYAGIADAYLILSKWGFYPREEGYNTARAFALKALELDEYLAEAHATLGAIYQWFDWNWAKADSELRRSIELNPNYAIAHQYYAEYLASTGNLPKAILEMNKALEINPLSKTICDLCGNYCYNMGQYSKALKFFQLGNNLINNNSNTCIDVFYVYLQQNKYKEAVVELTKYLSGLQVDNQQILNLDVVFEKSGIKGVMLWSIEYQLSQKNPQPYLLAELYAKVGQNKNALEWLEKAFDTNDILIQRIKFDRNLLSLHSEQRYLTLLHKMGLDVY